MKWSWRRRERVQDWQHPHLYWTIDRNGVMVPPWSMPLRYHVARWCYPEVWQEFSRLADQHRALCDKFVERPARVAA